LGGTNWEAEQETYYQQVREIHIELEQLVVAQRVWIISRYSLGCLHWNCLPCLHVLRRVLAAQCL